jgi:hypothetical protein
MFTKKPNFTKPAVMIGCGAVGAKLGDGVAAILPTPYGKIACLALGLAVTAFADGSKMSGAAVQGAGIGMAVNAGAGLLSDALKPQIAPQDASTTTGKFLNAVIGHQDADVLALATVSTARLNSPYQAAWEPAMPVEAANDTAWNREQGDYEEAAIVADASLFV